MNLETFFNTSQEKRFFYPGAILLSRDSADRVIQILRQNRGDGLVLLFYDKVFAGSDYLAKFKSEASLDIRLIELEGFPTSENAAKHVDLFKEHKIDSVVSIGGGSVADFAKAVKTGLEFGYFSSLGLTKAYDENGSTKTHVETEPSKKASIQYIAVPTTCGSGAEASRIYVTYRNVTKVKDFGRTWSCVANYTVVDGTFIENLPRKALIICAFDAFLHLFESFVIKNERSHFNDMVTTYHLPILMNSLARILKRVGTEEDYDNLAMASTMGGVAISNVRTGNIHEAAGGLFELVPLSHGEALFVFFEEAIAMYRNLIQDREALLSYSLAGKIELNDLRSVESLVAWWNDVFESEGITEDIRNAISALDQEVASNYIYERVQNDNVWNTKECPILMTSEMNKELISTSLRKFARTG